MRFLLVCLILCGLYSNNAYSATYTLEIIAPQPNLDLNSRWYRAYPGVEYRVPVGVFGGAYPFQYSLVTAP